MSYNFPPVAASQTNNTPDSKPYQNVTAPQEFLTVYWVFLEKKDEIASLFLDTFSSMWGGGVGSQIRRMKEGGNERAKFQTKKIRQQLVANNSKNSTVYTICFVDFLIHIARG